MLFKFNENDIFRQTIVTYPAFSFLFVKDVNDSSNFRTYVNNPLTTGTASSLRTDSLNKTEINVDRTGTQIIFPFVDKTSGKYWTSGYNSSSFNSIAYGSRITGTYLNYKTISRDFISDHSSSLYKSLKNIWNSQRIMNSDFNFDNFPTSSAVLLIPQEYYHGSIKKGSVVAGVVSVFQDIGGVTNQVRLAQDIYKDGILRVISDGMPANHPSSTIGNKVGYVLYDYGLVLFQSSTIYDYNSFTQEVHLKNAASNFVWSSGTDAVFNWKWFSDIEFCNEEESFYYCFLDFQGTNKIQNLTMLCNAQRGKLNCSLNPTSIQYGQNIYLTQTSENSFTENNKILIKNVVSSSYNVDENFQKETYISTVYIYDEDKQLIGTAKLANPLRKQESQDYTIKISYDM